MAHHVIFIASFFLPHVAYHARVSESADELDLGSSGQYARGGSNPPSRTNEIKGSRVFVNPGIKYKTV